MSVPGLSDVQPLVPVGFAGFVDACFVQCGPERAVAVGWADAFLSYPDADECRDV